ncbi:extracellular solute-binding protein [Anaerolineales bacterium HSG24]|nr:extracellular solute-binding protein [Anaerolineales bacterium HSG24]
MKFRNLLLCIAVIYLLSACNNDTPTVVPSPTVETATATIVQPTVEAVQLEISWQDVPPCQALSKLSSEYSKAEVKVNCFSHIEWYDKTFNDILKPDSNIDLVIMDSQWIGKAVTDNHLVEITDWVAENIESSKYVPAAISAYGEYPYNSKRYYGVPVFADTQMLVYRQDILDQAGFQPPRTWQELLDQAKTLEQKGLIPHGYATFWCGDCYDDVQTAWNQIAWSYGGELWEPETYQIEGVLNTPINVEALNMAAELYKVGPARSHFQGDLPDMICKGEVAMIATWFGYGPIFTDPTGCPEANNLAFGVLPAGPDGHVLSLGGAGIHLSAYSQHQTEALEFMAWLETRDSQLKWVELGSFSARTDVLASSTFAEATPYSPAFSASYLLVKDFWNLPEYVNLLPIQGHYLNLAITGKMDSAEALNELAKEQQAIIDQAYPDGPPKK